MALQQLRGGEGGEGGGVTVQPAPYPADTRAKGWRFELDMERARQSDTWTLAPADVRPWLLMMWATAWEQTPCGSLPNDDELIAARIGMPAKLFSKHRAILLRKWWTAEDGRLYHSVLVQRVLEMLESRGKNAARVAKFKAAQREQRATNALPARESPAKNDTGTSTSTSTNKDEKTKTARKRAAPAVLVSLADLIAEGINEQHATDWLVARKSKGLPLTPTAWADVKAEAAKAKCSPADAIKAAAGNGWGGFKASWLDEKPRNGHHPSAYELKAADAAKWIKGTSLDRSMTFEPEAFDAVTPALR